jgi:hypothetical protein
MKLNKKTKKLAFGACVTLLGTCITGPTGLKILHEHSDPAIDQQHRNPAAEAVRDADALNSGTRWVFKNAEDKGPYIVTYHFVSQPEGFLEKGDNVLFKDTPPSAELRIHITDAMADIESKVNIKFSDTATQGSHTNIELTNENRSVLTILTSDRIGQAGGRGQYPNPYYATVRLTSYFEKGYRNSMGSEHELCHALGLKHPFDSIMGEPTLPKDKDTLNETIMSYTASSKKSVGGHIADNFSEDNGPTTLMPLDIAALQTKYGANWEHSEVPGNKPIELNGKPRVWTIWNGKYPGIMDASHYKGGNAIIDLNPGAGHPTSIGKEHAFIAYGTSIVKAVGSKNGNDTLIGSDKGNSTLIGSQGACKTENFLVSGSGNHVTASPKSALNQYILNPDSDTHIKGFKPTDHIIAETQGKFHTSTERKGSNLELTIHMDDATQKPIHAVLEQYKGVFSSIHILSAPDKVTMEDVKNSYKNTPSEQMKKNTSDRNR